MPPPRRVARTRPKTELAKRELELLALVQDCTAITDEGQLVERFSDYVAVAGFTSIACIRWSGSDQLSADNVLVNTRPVEWLREYLAASFISCDGMYMPLFVISGSS